MKFLEQRDLDKIKRDIALNDFESMVYKFREWLREEENFPYVKEEEREKKIEELNNHEDWLYEDGSSANFTTFQNMHRDLKKGYDKYNKRKEEHEARKQLEEGSEKFFAEYEEKTRDLAETKTWITKEERQDVLDKITEVKEWLKKEIDEQNKKELFEDSSFKLEDVTKKMNQLKKLFTKVSSKKKPKPPKEEKKEEDSKKDEEAKKKEDAENKEKTEEETKKEEEEPSKEDL